jgi:hypothetical protein
VSVLPRCASAKVHLQDFIGNNAEVLLPIFEADGVVNEHMLKQAAAACHHGRWEGETISVSDDTMRVVQHLCARMRECRGESPPSGFDEAEAALSQAQAEEAAAEAAVAKARAKEANARMELDTWTARGRVEPLDESVAAQPEQEQQEQEQQQHQQEQQEQQEQEQQEQPLEQEQPREEASAQGWLRPARRS